MVNSQKKSNLMLAEKIKAAIDASKKTAKQIADEVGVSPQAVVGWKKTGAISKDSLALFAHAVGMHLFDFIDANKSTVRTTHPDDMQLDDMVYVPESRITFSAGNGRTASYELIEDEEPASYRLSWFQKYGINPDRVKRFRVSGDSMEPMLFARDTILVNMDETAILDNKMYAIRYGDELRVKYLRKKLDGTIILRSINPLYKEEEVSPALVSEHITIIGRVRDASGTGGL